ncbi:helix-turn-helix transcriptional regulator [Streptomyces sp. NBRC 110035]|uniref:helix-turn-helix domain-containing protein n=1 Tax=Streptomyces sp. NBRC 110035 TaxID=1547867 RepID=UPI000696EBFB|nr:helix-turn-helix transcriptional regulator [Streptomyces sp. NBRC 110035]
MTTEDPIVRMWALTPHMEDHLVEHDFILEWVMAIHMPQPGSKEVRTRLNPAYSLWPVPCGYCVAAKPMWSRRGARPATGVCRPRMSTEPASGHASTLVTQEMDGDGPTPVGRHLVEWRIRRGITVASMATRSGLPEQLIRELEAGRDWVDQRRILSALASGLRLDPAELTGQPYMPSGSDHSAVHSLVWHARQHLARALSVDSALGEAAPERLAVLVEGLQASDDAGDLAAAALKVPRLLELAGSPQPGDADRGAATLRAAAHVCVGRLLRRLGYWDLAWSMLRQAGPPAEVRPVVLGEEVRLLLDMGQAELAISRVARGEIDIPAEVLLPLAVAHATLGQEAESDRLLASAHEKAIDAQQQSQAAAAGAFVAAERGSYDSVLERAASAVRLPAGDRSALLVLTSSARARLGLYGAASEDLVAAETIAPLHTRLDPLARELVSVLLVRARAHAEELGAMAVRFGMR